jgi:hypothetical protein
MPPTSALSRRAALGLAATVPLALLTGCSGSGVKGRLDAGVDRLEAPRSTPPAPTNPDQPLVDAAVAAIADVRASLVPHRADDPTIAGLVRLHAVHLKALGAASVAGTATALGSGPVLTQVAAREQALGTLLAAKAGAARDGALARLLGAMSAAIAQHTAGGAA